MGAKWYRFIAVLCLVVLIAGCTGAAEEDGEATRESDGDGEGVSVVFSDWHLAEPVWEKSLNEAIGQFEEDNPDITVEMEVVSYAEKETKYATEIEAGRGPDVMHLQFEPLRNFMEQGYLLELNEFIEAEGGEDFTSQWYPIVMDHMKVDDTWYAMPGDFMTMSMFYNSQMLEDAGLDPESLPETWDEWLEWARELTGENQWGFGTVGAIDPGFALRVLPVFYSHDAQLLNDDESCSALNTPEAKEAFDFLTSLFTEEEVVPPGVTQQNPGTVREQLANEQIAMSFGSGWTPPIVDGLNPDLDAYETLVTGPVPLAEGADPEYRTTAWLSAWGINPNSENPEEAWELVKFLTSKETEEKFFDDNRVLSSRVDVSGAREGDGPEGYSELVNDKFASVVASQIPEMRFPPFIAELPQILEALNVATQQVYNGDSSSEEALGAAHEEINGILGGTDCPSL
jgi:ABC-type glycerol-3-phosphate transport system substrate-binding protein